MAESATPAAKRTDAKPTPPGVVGAKAAAAGLMLGSGAEALPAEAGSSMAESATPVGKRPDLKPTPPGVVGAKAEAGLMGPPPPRDSQRGRQRPPAEAGTEPAADVEVGGLPRVLFLTPTASPTRSPVPLGALSTRVIAPTPTTRQASRRDGALVTLGGP
jgi:hypothetical protein